MDVKQFNAKCQWICNQLSNVADFWLENGRDRECIYLRRDGNPIQPTCKSTTFKGPFHVPRCMILVDQRMT